MYESFSLPHLIPFSRSHSTNGQRTTLVNVFHTFSCFIIRSHNAPPFQRRIPKSSYFSDVRLGARSTFVERCSKARVCVYPTSFRRVARTTRVSPVLWYKYEGVNGSNPIVRFSNKNPRDVLKSVSKLSANHAT